MHVILEGHGLATESSPFSARGSRLVNADNLRSIRVLHDDDSHKEGALVRSYAQQRDDAQHLAREIAAEKDAADAMDG